MDDRRPTLNDPFAHLAADLDRLAMLGRRRALEPPGGIDFTSNDYLGLAGSEELRAAALAAMARNVPVGAGGSRLLRGNHPEHEALEAHAARYFGADSALYFGSGFAANLTLFATAPQRDRRMIPIAQNFFAHIGEVERNIEYVFAAVVAVVRATGGDLAQISDADLSCAGAIG